MEYIISKIYDLLKETNNLIEFEEQVHLLMYDTFADLVGEVFSQLDKVVKQEKQTEHWTVERCDEKSLQFTFGHVRYRRTLMYDQEGQAHYPLDRWLGFRKHQRYSPLVEIKVAELASESTYRESSRILKEWTAVDISHTTVGTIVKRVGEAQAQADQDMVLDLNHAAKLPVGQKKVDYLYTEADGVYVRDLKKKKHIEVSDGIMYEGWHKNGDRISLKQPKLILTTKPIDQFWREIQALSACEYNLKQTQIVSNSDGDSKYSYERFKEAYSQSERPLIHQLDAYHIQQSINRTFGYRKSKWKRKVRRALKDHDKDQLTVILDTYESQLEDEAHIEKLNEFKGYIFNHWDYIPDWRTRIKHSPSDARGLGAMESNQRRITFRMKKRGMHWSKAAGAEAMVKIKQGMFNQTLRDVYLSSQRRSHRKQRDVRKKVRLSSKLRQSTRPSIGVRRASIVVRAAHSSAIVRLYKAIR